jgi:hypothetical protein
MAWLWPVIYDGGDNNIAENDLSNQQRKHIMTNSLVTEKIHIELLHKSVMTLAPNLSCGTPNIHLFRNMLFSYSTNPGLESKGSPVSHLATLADFGTKHF